MAWQCLEREGLHRIFERAGDLEVVDVRLAPDVLVFVDPAPARDVGLARLVATPLPCGVVVVGREVDADAAQALVRRRSAGRAYLLCERLRAPADVVGAVHEVAAGGVVLDRRVLDELAVPADAPPTLLQVRASAARVRAARLRDDACALRNEARLQVDRATRLR